MFSGAFLPCLVLAQSAHFQPGFSVRNHQLGHYHHMVTWDDSPYKEFAYYETNANGAIKDFMNFRVAFPEDYDKNSSKKYPAIVMLHGAGESGRAWAGHYQYTPSDPEYDNNGRHMLFGALEHLFAIRRASSHPRSFPGIVIFPQVSANGAWVGGNIEKATKILEYMIEEYHVDPFRIFIHGLSNGGKGVWEFSTQRPDLFSAALPMSGVGTDLDVMTDSLVTMPIWLFQGELDKNPSQGWSKQWINALKAKGGKPRYTIYENTGHGTWKKAYAEDDFFSWILQHDKRQVYFFADETHVPAPDAPLMLGFSAGFLGYQWTRNGVDIPGATGRYYTATMEGAYAVKFKQRLGGQSWVESFELDLSDPAQCSVNGQPGLQVLGHAYLPLPEEESVDHTLSLKAEEGFSKYRWFRNGELLAETSENALLLNNASGSQFKAADAGIYTVVVENENGCLSSFSQPVQIQWADPGAEVETFVPYLHARGAVDLPLPDLIADKSLVLFGSPGFPSYRWYKDGKLIEGEHSDRLELNDEAGALFQPDDAGVYTFEVINEAGSRSQPSAGISVSFETLDEFVPVLLAKGLTDFPLADSIQDKSLTLVAPGGFAYYRWYRNDTLILESADSMLMLNNAAGTSFKKQDAGKYSVVVGRAGAYPSRYSNGIVVTFEDLSDFVPQLVAEGPTIFPLPDTVSHQPLRLIAPEGFNYYTWFKNLQKIGESDHNVLILNGSEKAPLNKTDSGGYTVVVSNVKSHPSKHSGKVQVVFKDVSVYIPELRAVGIVNLPLPDSATDKSLQLKAPGGFAYYAWYKDDNLIHEGTDSIFLLNDSEARLFTPEDSGLYTVVVAINRKWPSKQSNEIKISFNDFSAFTPELQVFGSTVLPLPDSVADKSLILVAPEGFFHYTWYKDGTKVYESTGNSLLLSDREGRSFRPDQAGNYSVVVAVSRQWPSLPSASVGVTFHDLSGYVPVLQYSGPIHFPVPDSVADKSLKLIAPDGYAHYAWYRDGALIYESAKNVLVLNGDGGRFLAPSEAGKYTVRVAFNRNWLSGLSEEIDLSHTDIASYEPAVIAIGSTDLPVPDSVEDKSLILEGPGGFSEYIWYKGSEMVAGGSDRYLILNDEAGKLFERSQAGTYFLVVTANGVSSRPSNSIAVTYQGDTNGYTPPVIRASAVSSSEIVVEWFDTDFELGYEIWRARKNTFSNSGAKTAGYPEEPLQQIAVVAADNTSYVDQFLRPGAEYVYFVKALAPEGKYTESETSAVLLPQDTTQPTAPRNLQVTSRTESEIGLEWTPSTDDDVVFRYEIFVDDEKVAEVMAEVPAEDGDPTDGNPEPETKFVLENLQPRTAYAIKVRALDYQGNDFQGNTSDFSNTVTTSVILGTNEPEVASQPLAYPNPFSREVSIRLPEPVERGRRVMVYDHTGSLVLTTLTETTAAVVAVDLSEVPDGLYILTLENFTFRLIKRN